MLLSNEGREREREELGNVSRMQEGQQSFVDGGRKEMFLGWKGDEMP